MLLFILYVVICKETSSNKSRKCVIPVVCVKLGKLYAVKQTPHVTQLCLTIYHFPMDLVTTFPIQKYQVPAPCIVCV